MVATTERKIRNTGFLAAMLGAAAGCLGTDPNGALAQILGPHYGSNNRGHLPKPTAKVKRQTPEEKQAALSAAEQKRLRKREKNKCLK